RRRVAHLLLARPRAGERGIADLLRRGDQRAGPGGRAAGRAPHGARLDRGGARRVLDPATHPDRRRRGSAHPGPCAPHRAGRDPVARPRDHRAPRARDPRRALERLAAPGAGAGARSGRVHLAGVSATLRPMVALDVAGLTKRYGAVRALEQVSFSVAPGEIFGYLGPNGAGKTTT